ncbi:MAG: hypothetical protein ACRET5_13430, partial [Steroidobacteraceae bacterium]
RAAGNVSRPRPRHACSGLIQCWIEPLAAAPPCHELEADIEVDRDGAAWPSAWPLADELPWAETFPADSGAPASPPNPVLNALPALLSAECPLERVVRLPWPDAGPRPRAAPERAERDCDGDESTARVIPEGEPAREPVPFALPDTGLVTPPKAPMTWVSPVDVPGVAAS